MGTRTISSTKEFYRAIRKGVCLVDFNAPWCAPCRLQEPIIEKLSISFQGKALVYTLNVDQFPDLAAHLDIKSIPTLIIFKEGGEVERIVGLQTEVVLFEALSRALTSELKETRK